jgi:hypothetical protein
VFESARYNIGTQDRANLCNVLEQCHAACLHRLAAGKVCTPRTRVRETHKTMSKKVGLIALGEKKPDREERPEGSELELFRDVTEKFRRGDMKGCISGITQAVSALRKSPSDPDPYYVLNLLCIAKESHGLFVTPSVYQVLVAVLSRDATHPYRKNNTTPVLVCNLLAKSFNNSPIWPLEFARALIEDALGDRCWVDDPNAAVFTHNLMSIFAGYPLQGTAQNRFSEPERYQIRTMVRECVDAALQQGQEAAKNLIRLLCWSCYSYPESRSVAASYLDAWLSHSITTAFAKQLLEVLSNVCRDVEDLELVRAIAKIQIKSASSAAAEISFKVYGNNPLFPPIGLMAFAQNALIPNAPQLNWRLFTSIYTAIPQNREAELAAVIRVVASDEHAPAKLNMFIRDMARALTQNSIPFDFVALCKFLMRDRPELNSAPQSVRESWITVTVEAVCLLTLTFGVASEADPERITSILAIAQIQLSAMEWCHTVVANFISNSSSASVMLSRIVSKLMLLEPLESYSFRREIEPERFRSVSSLLSLDEETMTRIVLMNLVPVHTELSGTDALSILERITLRAARCANATGVQFQVKNLRLIDAIFKLSIHKSPHSASSLFANAGLYWRACLVAVIISCFNPAFAELVWHQYPTLKALLEMCIVQQWHFPPLESEAKQLIERARQAREAEIALIIKFEGDAAAERALQTGEPVSLINEKSPIVLQLVAFTQEHVRAPSEEFVHLLGGVDRELQLGRHLCVVRQPDFLLDIIHRQPNTSNRWLLNVIANEPSIVSVLDPLILCNLLLELLDPAVSHSRDLLSRILATLSEHLRSDGELAVRVGYQFIEQLGGTYQQRTAANRALGLMLPSLDQGNPFAWIQVMETLPQARLLSDALFRVLLGSLEKETSSTAITVYVTYLLNRIPAEPQLQLSLALAIAGLLLDRGRFGEFIFEYEDYFRVCLDLCSRNLEMCSLMPTQLVVTLLVGAAGAQRQVPVLKRLLDATIYLTAIAKANWNISPAIVGLLFDAPFTRIVTPAGEAGLFSLQQVLRLVLSPHRAVYSAAVNALSGNLAALLKVFLMCGIAPDCHQLAWNAIAPFNSQPQLIDSALREIGVTHREFQVQVARVTRQPDIAQPRVWSFRPPQPPLIQAAAKPAPMPKPTPNPVETAFQFNAQTGAQAAALVLSGLDQRLKAPFANGAERFLTDAISAAKSTLSEAELKVFAQIMLSRKGALLADQLAHLPCVVPDAQHLDVATRRIVLSTLLHRVSAETLEQHVELVLQRQAKHDVTFALDLLQAFLDRPGGWRAHVGETEYVASIMRRNAPRIVELVEREGVKHKRIPLINSVLNKQDAVLIASSASAELLPHLYAAFPRTLKAHAPRIALPQEMCRGELDKALHRIVKALAVAGKSRSIAYGVGRYFAAAHKAFVLRNLGAFSSLLCGRSDVAVKEFISRGDHELFHNVLGVLETLQPLVFAADALKDILAHCIALMNAVRSYEPTLVPLFGSLGRFMRNFALQRKGRTFLLQHLRTLRRMSEMYSRSVVTPIASLSALVETLDKHSAHDKKLEQTNHAPETLMQLHSRLNCHGHTGRLVDAAAALSELDALSLYEPQLLRTFVDDLLGLCNSRDESLRRGAHSLVLRLLHAEPMLGDTLALSYLGCFDSEFEEVRLNALQRAPEYVFFMQAAIEPFFRRLFAAGATSLQVLPHVLAAVHMC